MKTWSLLSFSLLLIAGCSTGGRVTPAQSAAPIAVNCAGYVKGSNAVGDYVCAHNAARAVAKPAPARALPKLSWNANLAAVAQSYAESCTWAHNEDRSSQYNSRSGKNGLVGENLFVSTFPNASPYDAVASWASEVQFYSYKKNVCTKGQMCGHYTQVVWRETREVGCGTAFCSKVANSSLTNARMMVCNYTPAGNYIGQRPY